MSFSNSVAVVGGENGVAILCEVYALAGFKVAGSMVPEPSRPPLFIGGVYMFLNAVGEVMQHAAQRRALEHKRWARIGVKFDAKVNGPRATGPNSITASTNTATTNGAAAAAMAGRGGWIGEQQQQQQQQAEATTTTTNNGRCQVIFFFFIFEGGRGALTGSRRVGC